MASLTTNQLGPSSYGVLGKLPRELRDKIYEYLLGRDYCVMYGCDKEYCNLDHNIQKILRVSKAVNTEAIEILCSNGTFIFEFLYGSEIEYMPPSLATKLQYINNVEVIFGLWSFDEYRCEPTTEDWEERLQRQCEASLRLFGGDCVPRNTCKIFVSAHHGQYDNSAPERLVKSCLGQTCQTLLGFRVVHLIVDCGGTCRRWNKCGNHGVLACHKYPALFCAALEPFLGPNRGQFPTASLADASLMDLEFRPRDFCAQKRDFIHSRAI